MELQILYMQVRTANQIAACKILKRVARKVYNRYNLLWTPGGGAYEADTSTSVMQWR